MDKPTMSITEVMHAWRELARDEGAPLSVLAADSLLYMRRLMMENLPPLEEDLRAGRPYWGRHDRRSKVFLDGEPVKRCVAFDTKLGVVIQHMENHEGRHYATAAGEPAMEARVGKVTVEPPPFPATEKKA